MSAPADEIREAVRRFAREQLAPHAAQWDRDKTFPREALQGLAAMGLYGVAIPEQWGGAGLDYTSLAVACEEIAAGDCATSTIVAVNNLVAGILAGYGSEAQKTRFLKPLAQGKMLGAFALTEPQVGSDASAITTRAEKQGPHYVLNGVKQFITSGKNADIAVVFAVSDKAAGKKGISSFLVPTSTPGYVVARIEEKTGQRASDTAQIVLENCRTEHRLGEEGVGYRIALANLESGRINVAAQATGVARAALEAALAYARERKSMGKHLIEHQAVNFRLADMATQVEAARQLYLHAARLRDAGQPCLKEASMAKLFASEMAEKVCSDAIQIHGGYGYVTDFPVERFWRDVRVTKIYEGANDIQRMVIGRELHQ
jgi:butyryl-CoA dehydrogenase